MGRVSAARRVILRSLALCLLGIAVFGSGQRAARAEPVTVAIAAAPSQTIKGWGCIPSEQEGWSLKTGAQGSLVDRPAIQDAVYALGFTVVRCGLQPSYGLPDGQLNTSGSSGIDGLVKQLQIAAAHGVTQYVLCVWSPPAAMHDTGVSEGILRIYGDKRVSRLRPDRELAFTQFVTRAIRYLQDQGFAAPVAVEFQNAPDETVATDGTFYTPTSNPQTDPLCRVAKRLRQQLDNGGLQNTVVSGPDTSCYGHVQWYLGCQFAFLALPELKAAFGGISSHSYASADSGAEAVAELSDTVALIHKDLWMTEWSLPDGLAEIDAAIASARHFASDLVSVPNNYWFWRDAWTFSGDTVPGRALLGGTDKPVLTKRYSLFQKVWTTVRPGWKVKKVSSDSAERVVPGAPDSDMVAFENSAADRTVVLLINPHAEEQTMTVKGVKGASAALFRSGAVDDMAALPPTAVEAGAVAVTLPGHTITLIDAR